MSTGQNILNRPHLQLARNGQRGSVLLVSLIILLVLTVLGISSMTSSTMEEKMSGNTRDQVRAFQAAEIALRSTEAFIDTIASTDAFGPDNPGLYEQGNTPDVHDAITWNDENSFQLPADTVDGVTSQPRAVIEHLATVGNEDINIGGYGESSGVGVVNTYRVTIRATGGTNDAVVMIQAYYR